MCDRGFEWAKQNGLWQINPVHGEEEASLVIERLFQVEEQQCETTTQSGSFETQASSRFVVQVEPTQRYSMFFYNRCQHLRVPTTHVHSARIPTGTS